ncbi:MAG: hypothetical protein KJO54_03540 [Gammaproteobacteria bacterium]|nr:hypothetical protein [Gammaproteobacteria bacterium]NNF60861.1 hypothetical protein [Gammaproteobacteria bacterium]NNM21750.1 hypothetical protein [Gammaproteobacteria bacterium]
MNLLASDIAILAAGAFFLNALLTGVWKFRQMAASSDGQAHRYVDIAHRASLMYSFAALLLAVFAAISQLPDMIEILATVLVLVYFALAIASYMVQGLRRQTDNQIADMSIAGRFFMWSLVVGEIGGFVVLFYGVIVATLA